MFPKLPRRARGFTLIEVMVTVAIIGILAAVAYPSYVSYLVRNNRSAAQTYMMELSQAQAQFMADTRSYASTVDELELPVPDNVAAKYSIAIDLEAGPPSAYTITATPVTGGSQEDDGELTIDSAGTRTPGDKW